MESDLTAMSRDSLSFAAAQKLYLAGQTDAAAKSLRSYVRSYPKGYYLNDALYFLSDCYLRTGEARRCHRNPHRTGRAGYEPVFGHAVLEKLSELTYEDKRYDEAAAAFRKLYDVTTTVAGREDAMTGYVRATAVRGRRFENRGDGCRCSPRIPMPGPWRCANRNSHGRSVCRGSRIAVPMP
ncbi:MAG: tetratricopeptide repeat protein [Alistipes onderdonkii]